MGTITYSYPAAYPARSFKAPTKSAVSQVHSSETTEKVQPHFGVSPARIKAAAGAAAALAVFGGASIGTYIGADKLVTWVQDDLKDKKQADERNGLLDASKAPLEEASKNVRNAENTIEEAQRTLKNDKSWPMDKDEARQNLQEATSNLRQATDAIYHNAYPFLQDCATVVQTGSPEVLDKFLKEQEDAITSKSDAQNIQELRKAIVRSVSEMGQSGTSNANVSWNNSADVCQAMLNLAEPHATDAQKNEIEKARKNLESLDKKRDLNAFNQGYQDLRWPLAILAGLVAVLPVLTSIKLGNDPFIGLKGEGALLFLVGKALWIGGSVLTSMLAQLLAVVPLYIATFDKDASLPRFNINVPWRKERSNGAESSEEAPESETSESEQKQAARTEPIPFTPRQVFVGKFGRPLAMPEPPNLDWQESLAKIQESLRNAQLSSAQRAQVGQRIGHIVHLTLSENDTSQNQLMAQMRRLYTEPYAYALGARSAHIEDLGKMWLDCQAHYEGNVQLYVLSELQRILDMYPQRPRKRSARSPLFQGVSTLG